MRSMQDLRLFDCLYQHHRVRRTTRSVSSRAGNKSEPVVNRILRQKQLLSTGGVGDEPSQALWHLCLKRPEHRIRVMAEDKPARFMDQPSAHVNEQPQKVRKQGVVKDLFGKLALLTVSAGLCLLLLEFIV